MKKDQNLPAVEVKTVFKGINNLKKRAFLAAFCQTGLIVKSSEQAGIHWTSHYHWLKHDPKYVEAFDAAREVAADRFEEEIYRRGFVGYDKPVTYRGKITDHYKEYSDVLAIFALKGLRPGKYRENAIFNQFGGPQQFNIAFTNQPAQQRTERAETAERIETERILQSKVVPG